MPRETDSRARMMEATVRLMRTQGYHGTGLNQILEESQAPRGSLYYYFPGGKEELVAEALRTGGAMACGQLAEALERSPTTRAALVGLCRYAADQLEQSGYQAGCPLASVVLEAAATSDPIHEACSSALGRMVDAVRRSLVGEGLPEERAEPLATTLFAAYEGALLLSRAHRSVRPLRALEQSLEFLVPEPAP